MAGARSEDYEIVQSECNSWPWMFFILVAVMVIIILACAVAMMWERIRILEDECWR